MFGGYVAAINKEIYGFEYTSTSLEVDYGTSQDDIAFPTTITSIIALETSVSSDAFHHVDAPESNYETVDYNTYKYDAIYDNTDTYGYRIYGYIDDEDNPCWYACNSLGSIYYVIDDLDASWICDNYDAYTSDTYTFTLNYDTNTYSYSGILPTITVTVGENPIATVAEEDEPTLTATNATYTVGMGDTIILPSGTYTFTYSDPIYSTYFTTGNMYEAVTSITSGSSYYIVNANEGTTFLTSTTTTSGGTNGLYCINDSGGVTEESNGTTYISADSTIVSQATAWTFTKTGNNYYISSGNQYIYFDNNNVKLNNGNGNNDTKLAVTLVDTYFTISNGNNRYLDKYSISFAGGWTDGASNSNEQWYIVNTTPAAVSVTITNYAKKAGTITATSSTGDVYTINIEGVDTITNNTTTSGTVINLFDYWYSDQDTPDITDTTQTEIDNGIDANHLLKFWNGNTWKSYNTIGTVTGNYNNESKVTQGIVANTLTNGYPTLSGNTNILGNNTTYNTESLAYLFDPTLDASGSADGNADGKASYSNVSGLLQMDSEGYYYYTSSSTSLSNRTDSNGNYITGNYAEYDEETNSFVLYDDWAVTYGGDGQFFPFNSYSQYDSDGTTYLTEYNTSSGTVNVTRDTISYQANLNHYFGMSMTTKFIQQYGGYTSSDQKTAMTFEFSGDDDVWIFIDDVLVADIGGVRDTANVTIDFSTGKINITNKDGTVYDSQGNYMTTTLYDAFKEASKEGTVEWTTTSASNTIFADNTYHTLKFFYLERGNWASNLTLRFNLTEIPETGIYKVNQYGEAIEGATFAVYSAYKDSSGNYYYKVDSNDSSVISNLKSIFNGNYVEVSGTLYILSTALSEKLQTDGSGFTIDESSGDIKYNDTTIINAKYIGTTDSNGEMVFVDDSNMYYSIQELEDMFGSTFILKEIDVPEGYRLVSDDVYLRIVNSQILVCDNTYSSGVYTSAHETITATDVLYSRSDNTNTVTLNGTEIKPGDSFTYHDVNTSTVNGTLFAVVLKYIGSDDYDTTTAMNTNNWAPIVGSDQTGYSVYDSYTSILQAAIDAANEMKDKGYSDTEFTLASSGAMQVTLTALPGDIETYYHMLSDSDKSETQYAIAYYWTSASSVENATVDNTIAIDDTVYQSGFSRVFGATINVPNLQNAIVVQKLDSDGETLVDGATFAMYKVSEVNNKIYYVAADDSLIYLEEDDDGDNEGVAWVSSDPSTFLTYVVDSDTSSSTYGYILVKNSSGNTLYTIKPIEDNSSTSSYYIDTTAYVDAIGENGSIVFYSMDSGTYYIREINSPEGYDINTTEIMVKVTDDTVYANAGTEDDGVTVARAAGYLVKTLAQMAVEGDVDNTLTWIYTLLKVNESESNTFNFNTDINDSSVWPYAQNGSSLLKTYLEYVENSTSTLFNYLVNTNTTNIDGTGTRRLYTDVGWSYLEIYQDSDYYDSLTDKGTYNYTDLGDDPITNLFSRTVYVQVQDDRQTEDISFVKIDGDNVTATSGVLDAEPTGSNLLSDATFTIYETTESEGTYTKGRDVSVVAYKLDITDEILLNTVLEKFSTGEVITNANGTYVLASAISLLIDDSTSDFTKDDNTGYISYENTVIINSATTDITYQIVSNSLGNVIFKDLEVGKTYWIEETSSIEGYEKSTWYWLVTIDYDGTITYNAQKVDTTDNRDMILEYIDNTVTTYYWPNYETISISFIKISGYSAVTDENTGYLSSFIPIQGVAFGIYQTITTTEVVNGENITIISKGDPVKITVNGDEINYTETSNSTGKVNFENLEINTTYWIEEISGLDGYEAPTWHWIVAIDSDGKATYTYVNDDGTTHTTMFTSYDDTTDKMTYYWPNYTVYTLPQFGGIGIYWFIMIGVIMMISSSMIWLYRYQSRRRDIKT